LNHATGGWNQAGNVLPRVSAAKGIGSGPSEGNRSERDRNPEHAERPGSANGDGFDCFQWPRHASNLGKAQNYAFRWFHEYELILTPFNYFCAFQLDKGYTQRL
jgi:hypothetical protein